MRSAPGTERRRVLVVEDHVSLRESLERQLRGQFASVRGCGGVADVRAELAEQAPPDLVLLDVSLGDGDAFDVLDALEAAGCRPAVVAMTGSAALDVETRLARRGVRVLLRKPLTGARLGGALRRALSAPPAARP